MDYWASMDYHKFLDVSVRYVKNSTSRYVEGYKFKYYHIPALVVMHNSPGISQKGLCARVPMDKSRISIVVREIIEMGMAVNESTGKVWSLRLTPKGEEAYETAIQATLMSDDRLFEAITDEEKEAFVAICKKLSARIAEIQKGDPR